MNTKKKIGMVFIIVFLVVGWGIAGSLDLKIQKANDEWEEENLPPKDYTDFNESDIADAPAAQELVDKQWGIASFYDYKMEPEIDENGLFTGKEIGVPCNGALEECFTKEATFAASRKFKRGDVLTVTNLENQRFVNVIVTDYIEHPDRVIDLTSFAFSKIADLEEGLIDVRIELIGNIDDIEPTNPEDI